MHFVIHEVNLVCNSACPFSFLQDPDHLDRIIYYRASMLRERYFYVAELFAYYQLCHLPEYLQ